MTLRRMTFRSLRSGDTSPLATTAEIKALLEGEEEDPQFKRKRRRLRMRPLKDEGGAPAGGGGNLLLLEGIFGFLILLETNDVMLAE